MNTLIAVDHQMEHTRVGSGKLRGSILSSSDQPVNHSEEPYGGLLALTGLIVGGSATEQTWALAPGPGMLGMLLPGSHAPLFSPWGPGELWQAGFQIAFAVAAIGFGVGWQFARDRRTTKLARCVAVLGGIVMVVTVAEYWIGTGDFPLARSSQGFVAIESGLYLALIGGVLVTVGSFVAFRRDLAAGIGDAAAGIARLAKAALHWISTSPLVPGN